MIARRSLLALFGAAPALAPAVAAQTMQAASSAPYGPPPVLGCSTEVAGDSPPAAIMRLIRERDRAMEEEDSERYRRRDSMRIAGLEQHIAAPRSWSGAFRCHLQIQRDNAAMKAHRRRWDDFLAWKRSLLGETEDR